MAYYHAYVVGASGIDTVQVPLSDDPEQLEKGAGQQEAFNHINP